MGKGTEKTRKWQGSAELLRHVTHWSLEAGNGAVCAIVKRYQEIILYIGLILPSNAKPNCMFAIANLRHAFKEHGKKTLTLGVEMPWTGWHRLSQGNLSLTTDLHK